ncbi:polyphenol oxidase family protein [Akkermansiaceae bacterium]|nr:polyphenol oxidase family protein [Akkermansiaceae bacterium]
MTEAFLFLNPISSIPGFRADWIPRLSEVDVLGDRDFALRNLAPHHDTIIAERFPETLTRHHAEQIHGNRVALIDSPSGTAPITHPLVDGLITNLPGQLLAIYVADCAAIYLADPVTRSIALLHSGKKGTEGNILAAAVGKMEATFGTDPADLICALSPCIRPPDYEVDIASTIAAQARGLGIRNYHDSCENTASDLTRHYSYRIEKGQTGRMLALLSLSTFSADHNRPQGDGGTN